MIVWLNGTFGAGKTSTANELVRILPGARIYDPAVVGTMLRHVLSDPVGDFQDWPPWRPLVVQTAAEVHRYTGGILVAPAALLRPEYARQIFEGLAAVQLATRHFVVHADEDELIRRIWHDRTVPQETQRWRLEHLAGYRAALGWLPGVAEILDTTRLTPAEAAREIAGRL
ncbi:MAG TPA: ATP-binding protein [Actinomycetes bacterium]|nr:ATP-binding protein [Actinomycetes bacterium]